MPVTNYEIYCQMLDRDREKCFVYPCDEFTSRATGDQGEVGTVLYRNTYLIL